MKGLLNSPSRSRTLRAGVLEPSAVASFPLCISKARRRETFFISRLVIKSHGRYLFGPRAVRRRKS
jgi:hypothetical protein